MKHTLASTHARAVAIVALAAVASGCGDPLEVDIVGTVTDASVKSAAAANALRVGTLGSVNNITVGGTGIFERGWVDIGLMTDEWKTSGPQQQYGELDRRAVPNTNTNLGNYYSRLHQTRARAREAIDALTLYQPAPAWGIGQMYIATALAELQLGEHFCNGVPMSGIVNGAVVYATPSTNEQIFQLANAHLDTAITFLSAADATTVLHLNLAKILKARVLLNLGGQAPAAAAQVSGIPTSYAYELTFAAGTGDNGIWSANISIRAATVGDSVDAVGRVLNAIPFASANDPRVPVVGSSIAPSSEGFGADGGTPMVILTLWGRSDAVNLASGLDARLIEAEAALQADDINAMMTILNALRAAPPALAPSYTPAALPSLAAPGTKDEAVSLYFREKGFWTFGRGQRMADLRRLVRQYGRASDTVFPAGEFFKGGTYGTDVNMDVSNGELANPNFPGTCIDRNA